MSENSSEPWYVTWTIRIMALVIGLSLIGGIAVALIGGSLTELGKGYGGGYGYPDTLLNIPFLLTIPIAIVLVRRLRPGNAWLRTTLLVTGGIWVVVIGYGLVGHLLDPCNNGWWDINSQVGGGPHQHKNADVGHLCEGVGSAISIHTRFHLLSHAGPAAILFWLYLLALRRWAYWGAPTADLH